MKTQKVSPRALAAIVRKKAEEAGYKQKEYEYKAISIVSYQRMVSLTQYYRPLPPISYKKLAKIRKGAAAAYGCPNLVEVIASILGGTRRGRSRIPQVREYLLKKRSERPPLAPGSSDATVSSSPEQLAVQVYAHLAASAAHALLWRQKAGSPAAPPQSQ